MERREGQAMREQQTGLRAWSWLPSDKALLQLCKDTRSLPAACVPGEPTGGKDGEPRARHGNARLERCPSAQAALGEEDSGPW